MKTGGRGFKWKGWWEITADGSWGRAMILRIFEKLYGSLVLNKLSERI